MRYLSRITLFFLISLLFIGAGEKNIQFTEGIQPGSLAPEINLQGIDLLNKDYVLVQFWAAYDPQSRVMNTRMHNVISLSEATNIQFVSISLDESPAVFKGVLKADQLDESTQFNDPRGKNSELYKKFRLQSGFNNWLIDSDGMIVARNISPSEILKLIKV
ncbi:thioredoxin family protein [Bacteroidales bacterium OttesenSCG-928-M06]|nr:thioredoxin family protein [Bacteroidales bacterium OttesenSCG-928-M06]